MEYAYILHTKAYRETSLILKVLTKQDSVVDIIAKGVKRPRKGLGILQPFNLLLMQFVGNTDLLIFKTAENAGKLFQLQAQTLAYGLYLNELLYKLLIKGVQYDGVFALYHTTLDKLVQYQCSLHNINALMFTLRIFEKNLLDILGYGIDLEYDTYSRELIETSKQYLFNPYQGLFAYKSELVANNLIIPGSAIVMLRDKTQLQDFNHCSEDLRSLKHMLRLAINVHLTKPIQSSMFFKK